MELVSASGRLTGFDCEAGEVPPNYADLIADLIEITQGDFQVEAVSQVVEADTGEVHVRFVHAEQAHHIIPRDFGDWFDVRRTIGGLNAALQRAGQSRRFLLLYTGDQTCLVTFAPELGFRDIALDLRLPLESNAEAAQQAGVAYETHVLRKIEEEGELDHGNSDQRS